jgi:hypothetical protein
LAHNCDISAVCIEKHLVQAKTGHPWVYLFEQTWADHIGWIPLHLQTLDNSELLQLFILFVTGVSIALGISIRIVLKN